MKKTYLVPQTDFVKIKTEYLMQTVSGNGESINFGNAAGGEEGEYGDARRGGFWDDDY